MTKELEQVKMEALFQLGLKYMKKVLKIQDKLYEFDELYGEKFNEAITDEIELR
jgi:hypothetical protein